MSRLFVDCDDTLVLWLTDDAEVAVAPNPYGGGHDKWEPNHDLIAAIEATRGDYDEVIVWTGGGVDYARAWHIGHSRGPREDAGRESRRKPVQQSSRGKDSR